jgi:hypothetical protein
MSLKASSRAKQQFVAAQRRKVLWRPVEVKSITVEELRRQEMDFVCPGDLGTRDQAPKKQASWGNVWVINPETLYKIISVETRREGITWGCPQRGQF